MNNTKNYNNTLIPGIKRDIDSLKGQISTLRYIMDPKNNVTGVNLAETEAQIQKLSDQKRIFKTQLKGFKAEIEKDALGEEAKRIEERLVTNTQSIDQNNEKFSSMEGEIERLNNELASLKLLEKDGYEGVGSLILQQEENIRQKKQEIEAIKNEVKPTWLCIEQSSLQLAGIKTKIFHVETITQLKCELESCKLRLKELHRGLAGQVIQSKEIEQKEEVIKAEMKNIIKDMIHSESFFKVQTELRKANETLASLEVLKSEGEEISDQEISDMIGRTKELEQQINAELRKTKLQIELKGARAELINLKSCIGVEGIEDVSGIIKEVEIRVVKLDDEIAQITTSSLNIAKPISERAVIDSKGVSTNKEVNLSDTSGALMTQELQKWLAEHMINEALGADMQEVIVAAALLNLTKSKVGVTNSQTEDKSTQSKVTTLAMGACEKFCMTRVLQYLVSQNPVYSAAYGVAIIANHCILGDRQLSTLMSKVKGFIVAESIKVAGTTILGSIVTGTVGTFAAIPAGLYLMYNVGSQYMSRNTAEKGEENPAKVNPLPARDLSAAAIDMVADLTVESIWEKICSRVGRL